MLSFVGFWPSGSGEEDENVKSLRQRQRRQRRTTDKFWSEKLTWAFGSGELKRRQEKTKEEDHHNHKEKGGRKRRKKKTIITTERKGAEEDERRRILSPCTHSKKTGVKRRLHVTTKNRVPTFCYTEYNQQHLVIMVLFKVSHGMLVPRALLSVSRTCTNMKEKVDQLHHFVIFLEKEKRYAMGLTTSFIVFCLL